jgi:hypothetical protein
MVMRLVATGCTALIGGYLGLLPGAPLAGLSLIAGVFTGAVVSYIFTRPILRGPLARPEPPADQLSLSYLTRFYIPLALTNVINFIGQPLLAFGLSRGRMPLESLALWPVLSSLSFLFRSVGFGYQEVVIALLHRPNAQALRRFAWVAGAVAGLGLFLVGATPLNRVWYGTISGLAPDLVQLSALPTLIIAPTALLAFIVSWQRGVIVEARRTRLITLGVVTNIAVLMLAMLLGLRFLALPGIVIAASAFTLAVLGESLFLGSQARRLLALVIRPAPPAPMGEAG